MTKSKAFKLFLLALVAIFAIGLVTAFVGCGESEETGGGSPSNPEGTDEDGNDDDKKTASWDMVTFSSGTAIKNNYNGQSGNGVMYIEVYYDGTAQYYMYREEGDKDSRTNIPDNATYVISDVKSGTGTITFTSDTWKNMSGIVAVKDDGSPYEIIFEECFGHTQHVEFELVS